MIGNPYDQEALAMDVRKGVTDVVRKQAQVGLNVPSEGEHSKVGFSSYVNE